ncbi:hypothetical protein LCGC14_0405560 [marine sediment metagenome]|uniref:Uncharacterized protein n=1 Tax=marine sediment metagenome TaxID=412755 RepID=A0A0F9TDJ1_9ZZZZ
MDGLVIKGLNSRLDRMVEQTTEPEPHVISAGNYNWDDTSPGGVSAGDAGRD